MHRLGYGAMHLTGEGILGPPKDSSTLGSSDAVLWSWASHWNHFSNSWPNAENGIHSDPPEWLDTVNVPSDPRNRQNVVAPALNPHVKQLVGDR